MNILVIDGGSRYKGTCPGEHSKSKLVVNAIKGHKINGVTFSFVDLSIKGDGKTVQPCKGCIGTAGGYHCHFPCSCYGPKSASAGVYDTMYAQDVYGKLEKCDGFIVVTPIHWYSSSSQVKMMFDRLVCVNKTLTVEDAMKMFGSRKDIKNPILTQAASRNMISREKQKNHLEGKVAAFYVYGDDGASDYVGQKMPDSMQGKRNEGFINKAEQAVMEYVWQCRYSGIYAPDELVHAKHHAEGLPYADGDKVMRESKRFTNSAKSLLIKLVDEIRRVKK